MKRDVIAFVIWSIVSGTFGEKNFAVFQMFFLHVLKKSLSFSLQKKEILHFFFRICNQNVRRLSKISGSVVKNDSWVSRETFWGKSFLFRSKIVFFELSAIEFRIFEIFFSALLSKLLSLSPIESFAKKQRVWQKTNFHCFFFGVWEIKSSCFLAKNFRSSSEKVSLGLKKLHFSSPRYFYEEKSFSSGKIQLERIS